MTRCSIALMAVVVASIAAAPAPAAVLTFTGTGNFGTAGTPFTVSFSWDTSVRPVLGTQPAPGPGGAEPAPQFTSNPLRSPLTVTGSFGSFSYADPSFITRYENGQVRYSVSANTYPPSQPLRIVDVIITAPAPADPYNTDLPSDLTGIPAFFNFTDERVAPTLDGGAVAFGRGVAAIPEPASWTLMLLGFAGIGMVLRQRRRPLLQPAFARV